jgi:hypothetical protein
MHEQVRWQAARSIVIVDATTVHQAIRKLHYRLMSLRALYSTDMELYWEIEQWAAQVLERLV